MFADQNGQLSLRRQAAPSYLKFAVEAVLYPDFYYNIFFILLLYIIPTSFESHYVMSTSSRLFKLQLENEDDEDDDDDMDDDVDNVENGKNDD